MGGVTKKGDHARKPEGERLDSTRRTSLFFLFCFFFFFVVVDVVGLSFLSVWPCSNELPVIHRTHKKGIVLLWH